MVSTAAEKLEAQAGSKRLVCWGIASVSSRMVLVMRGCRWLFAGRLMLESQDKCMTL